MIYPINQWFIGFRFVCFCFILAQINSLWQLIFTYSFCVWVFNRSGHTFINQISSFVCINLFWIDKIRVENYVLCFEYAVVLNVTHLNHFIEFELNFLKRFKHWIWINLASLIWYLLVWFRLSFRNDINFCLTNMMKVAI